MGLGGQIFPERNQVASIASAVREVQYRAHFRASVRPLQLRRTDFSASVGAQRVEFELIGPSSVAALAQKVVRVRISGSAPATDLS